jgi:hypothetical protein
MSLIQHSLIQHGKNGMKASRLNDDVTQPIPLNLFGEGLHRYRGKLSITP